MGFSTRRALQFALLFGVGSRVELILAQVPSCSCSAPTEVSSGRQGSWFVATTTNFQVCSLESRTHAEQIAHHCEKVRASLVHTWCERCAPWIPKCQVILYRTKADYVR